MQQSTAIILQLLSQSFTILTSNMKLISQLSWVLDGVFGSVHHSDSSFMFALSKPITTLKKERTCHRIIFQSSFFRLFVATFRVDKFRGFVPTHRFSTSVESTHQPIPTEVLPEIDLSEASMTQERGEEIKTQLKEMSLGFGVKHPKNSATKITHIGSILEIGMFTKKMSFFWGKLYRDIMILMAHKNLSSS